MTMADITILGLGPGKLDELTLEARNVLAHAVARSQTIYFRTLIHPVTAPLKMELPEIQVESFDSFYDEAEDWSTLYQRIAEKLCTLAAQQPLIYAVPGHPLVGEISVQHVLKLAREQNLRTTIVAGLSLLEPVFTQLELDPLNGGTQLVDATELVALRADEVAGKLIPTLPALVTHIYNRRLASDVKLALSECYPDTWPIKLVRAASVASTASETYETEENEDAGETEEAGDSGGETVIEIPLYQLDHDVHTNHLDDLYTVYLPPVDELTALRLPETLRYIIWRLRRDPDGCPWDRQQTHQTLTPFVIEEAYEVVEALEEQDMEKLAEELGDLLLQVYLHAEIARQEEDFAIGDVYEHINAKMIRRHPHIFGTTNVENAGQVVQNWEMIKRQERAAAGKDVQNESVLHGVPLASPALIVSQEYQKRVGKVGFDYSDIRGVYKKIDEEIQELQQANTPEEQREEFGDLLFIVARLARFLKIDAEEALRRSNRKFRYRFQYMEEQARQQERALNSYSNQEWRDLWAQAKVHSAGDE